MGSILSLAIVYSAFKKWEKKQFRKKKIYNLDLFVCFESVLWGGDDKVLLDEEKRRSHVALEEKKQVLRDASWGNGLGRYHILVPLCINSSSCSAVTFHTHTPLSLKRRLHGWLRAPLWSRAAMKLIFAEDWASVNTARCLSLCVILEQVCWFSSHVTIPR